MLIKLAARSFFSPPGSPAGMNVFVLLVVPYTYSGALLVTRLQPIVLCVTIGFIC